MGFAPQWSMSAMAVPPMKEHAVNHRLRVRRWADS
jgi:hypothetical protein